MRKTLIAVALAATAALAALPGTALGQTYSVQKTVTANGNTLNEGANARVLRGDATTIDVSLDCFANTSPPAAAIGLQACHIIGADGVAYYEAHRLFAIPGSFNATAEVFRTIPRQRYRVCVDSNAMFRDMSEWLEAPLVCSA